MHEDSALLKWDEVGRSQWFGLKYYAKCLLSHPRFNRCMVSVLKQPLLLKNSKLIPRLPVNKPEVTGRAGDVSFTLTCPLRCCIAKELFWGDGQRTHAPDRLALRTFAVLSAVCDTILDIGSNTGIFSIAAARANPNAHVHAYEILPEAADLLEQNALRNGCRSRVHVHRVGIGRDGDMVTLPGLNKFSSVPTGLSTKSQYTYGTTVAVHSLDAQASLIASQAEVLLKIDVEGTEDEIFAGGTHFLQCFRPCTLCEILPRQRNARNIASQLKALGYRFYRIDDDRLNESPELIPSEQFHDWLLVPRDEIDLLSAAGINVTRMRRP